jgi:hypothetical protein
VRHRRHARSSDGDNLPDRQTKRGPDFGDRLSETASDRITSKAQQAL